MTDVLLYSNDLNMFDVFSTTLIQQQQLMQSNVMFALFLLSTTRIVKFCTQAECIKS